MGKTTNNKQKKEFFLARWMKSLLNWLDTKLFTTATAEALRPVYVPIFWSFALSFAGCIIVGIQSLFAENEEKFATIVFSIILAITVGITIWYLISDLKRFKSIGVKIGRVAYMLVLEGVAFAAGFYLAIIVLIVCILLFVLWLLFMMVFGDDNKKKKRIRLSNGDEVTEEKGLAGESYYTGSSGKEYDKVGEDTYVEK